MGVVSVNATDSCEIPLRLWNPVGGEVFYGSRLPMQVMLACNRWSANCWSAAAPCASDTMNDEARTALEERKKKTCSE